MKFSRRRTFVNAVIDLIKRHSLVIIFDSRQEVFIDKYKASVTQESVNWSLKLTTGLAFEIGEYFLKSIQQIRNV